MAVLGVFLLDSLDSMPELKNLKTKTEKAYVVDRSIVYYDRRQLKEHSAIKANERVQFPFPVLPNSPVASSICSQSSYIRHDGYGFCGYILGVPKRSSS